MLEDSDLRFQLPVLMADKTIKMVESENSINSQIKKIHSNGKKVALLLDEYEYNKDRFPSIELLLQNKYDLFALKEDDIVFFKADDGFSI
jgi:hypothetical protein